MNFCSGGHAGFPVNRITAFRHRQRRATRPFSVPLVVALVSAVLVVVGSVGPWARVPGYRNVYSNQAGDVDVFWMKGVEAPGMIPLVGDGMVSLILGGVAGALVLWRLARPGSSAFVLLAVFILLLVSGMLGVANWSNAGNIPQRDPAAFFPGDVEVSWGLIMMTLAAWPGVVSSAYQLWKDELQ
jgi:hypothetical protein